jgi:DNA polymerase III gamma/tau subunit
MATGMTRTQAAKILSSALNCVNARTAESLDPAFR